MKVVCKKTGKDVTGKVIKMIEKRMIKNGHRLFKISYTRDENGKLVQHKTEITHD